MRTERGFTLIEVLVALLIVASAIIAASSMWSGNFMRIRKATLQFDVATLLERKMAEIEAKYAGKPLAEIPEEESGDFEADFPQYRWTMRSRELELPDLSAMLIGQQEGVDETLISMIKQMSEFLSKSIKEVKVTIHFKRKGGKELEYAATQYFVDYSQTFAGGAGGGGP
ncbi:MAG TPA: prepilin-type N-terminal cleavage/methylation domain-containing protein [Bdellovibrionales bacterium]|nr:prepilin-type N-terminal cleavage/methylation domain-containing protein [Bdellovibrionales bacterium]